MKKLKNLYTSVHLSCSTKLNSLFYHADYVLLLLCEVTLFGLI